MHDIGAVLVAPWHIAVVLVSFKVVSPLRVSWRRDEEDWWKGLYTLGSSVWAPAQRPDPTYTRGVPPAKPAKQNRDLYTKLQRTQTKTDIARQQRTPNSYEA